MIKEAFEKVREFFTGKKEIRCRRCGRVLKSAKSKELGVGECCMRKILDEKYTRKIFIPKDVDIS